MQTTQPITENALRGMQVLVAIATRVAEFMFDQGLARAKRPSDVRSWIEGQLYHPRY